MQDYPLPGKEMRPNFVLAAPICPICKLDMRFFQAMPVPFTPGLDDVSYVCDDCGQRTKRTIQRT